MNSRQLNFFITPTDWPDVLNFIKKNNIKIIAQEVSDPSQFALTDIINPIEQSPRKILLANSAFNSFFFEYSELKNVYLIDTMKSYVIEFSPGGFFPNNPRCLNRGRLFCIDRYYADNGEQIEKSQDFQDWVRCIYNKFKKEFLAKVGQESMVLFSKSTLKLIHEKNGVIDPGYLKIDLN